MRLRCVWKRAYFGSLKMKLFLLILVTVAAVGAQAPQPCCIPEQYIAGIGGMTGISNSSSGPMAIASYQYGAFDFKNRMFGTYIHIDYLNGTSFRIKYVQKYALDTQWVIVEDMSFCIKQEAQKPEPARCIPDNTTLQSTVTLGGQKGLVVDSWGPIQVEAATVRAVITIGVTHGTCYPVSVVGVGDYTDGSNVAGIMATSGTVNMTIGIPDPDQWFQLPSYCDQENTVSSETPFSLDILKLLSTFSF